MIVCVEPCNDWAQKYSMYKHSQHIRCTNKLCCDHRENSQAGFNISNWFNGTHNDSLVDDVGSRVLFLGALYLRLADVHANHAPEVGGEGEAALATAAPNVHGTRERGADLHSREKNTFRTLGTFPFRQHKRQSHQKMTNKKTRW